MLSLGRDQQVESEMEIDPRDELKEEFERQAEWRRQKASEYPDDSRNLEAAQLFDKLAATVNDVDLAVLRAWRELFEDLPDSEEYNEMMRQVGFHIFPETADEFVRRFIASITS
jgi:hypothetical protein